MTDLRPKPTDSTINLWRTLMKPIDHLLTEIALDHMDIPTLETRKSDSLDFHAVGVWEVRNALTDAFNAGVKAAGQPAPTLFTACQMVVARWERGDLAEAARACSAAIAEAEKAGIAQSPVASKTAHTPTPWSLFDKSPYGLVITPPKPGPDIAIICTTGRWSDEWLANARRIVAAVNACEGIGTEALETALIAELFEALADLLGDMPDVQNGRCIRCGREYHDIEEGECPSDDCPSYKPRALLRIRSSHRHGSQS